MSSLNKIYKLLLEKNYTYTIPKDKEEKDETLNNPNKIPPTMLQHFINNEDYGTHMILDGESYLNQKFVYVDYMYSNEKGELLAKGIPEPLRYLCNKISNIELYYKNETVYGGTSMIPFKFGDIAVNVDNEPAYSQWISVFIQSKVWEKFTGQKRTINKEDQGLI